MSLLNEMKGYKWKSDQQHGIANPQWLHKQLSDLQEKIYRQVMEACLGRSAELSDCPRFSFVSHEAHPGRQFFSFDGAMVGEFSYFLRQEGDKWLAGFEFIPKTYIDNAS